jgi:hypothetical protein
VSRLAKSPRAHHLLGDLGTQPGVIYLEGREWGGVEDSDDDAAGGGDAAGAAGESSGGGAAAEGEESTS